MPFAVTQQRFRFYNDDGSITTATAAAAENANLSITDGGGNKSYHLLIQMQETGGTSGATTDDWQLQYSKNAGAWTNVTTTSSNVKAFDSANLTDGGSIATGDFRLTAGTGTAQAGEISEDGLLDDFIVRSTQYNEILFTIQTVDTDLAATDTLDFRVLLNGATTGVTYSVTPRITNNAGAFSQAPGIGTETDTALALTAVNIRAIGVSTETDTSLALSTGGFPVGLSTEADTALALSQVQIRPIDAHLITNNHFDVDTSGWSASAAATLSSVNGRLRVETSGGAAWGYVQVTGLTVGDRYRLSGDAISGTGGSPLFRLGSSAGSGNFGSSDTTTAWTATQTSAYVSCWMSGTAGQYYDFDNVYFRQELRDTNTALTLGMGLSVGLATETDTAFAISYGVAINTGLATEIDTALSRTATHLKALGLSTETDVSLDLTEVLISPVGLSTETELAIAEGLGLGFTTATETDTGLTLGYVQAGTVKMAQERNYSWPSGPNASIDFIDGYSSMFGKNLRNYPPKAFQLSHKRLKTFNSPSFSKGRPR